MKIILGLKSQFATIREALFPNKMNHSMQT